MTGRSFDDKLNLAVMQVLRKDGLSFGPRTADYLGVTAVHDSNPEVLSLGFLSCVEDDKEVKTGAPSFLRICKMSSIDVKESSSADVSGWTRQKPPVGLIIDLQRLRQDLLFRTLS